MKGISKLRKEKLILKRYLDICTNNIIALNSRKHEYDCLLADGLISSSYYEEQISCGVKGKSFDYWIRYNTQLADTYHRRLNEIESQITSKSIIAGSLSLTILIIFILFAGSPTITSNVIFGESQRISSELFIQVNESSGFTIPIEGINFLAFDGSFIGENATIYAETDSGRALVARFETSANFTRYCGGICDTPFSKPATLYAEMGENSSLTILKSILQECCHKGIHN
jgi:hypothetical protein